MARSWYNTVNDDGNSALMPGGLMHTTRHEAAAGGYRLGLNLGAMPDFVGFARKYQWWLLGAALASVGVLFILPRLTSPRRRRA